MLTSQEQGLTAPAHAQQFVLSITLVFYRVPLSREHRVYRPETSRTTLTELHELIHVSTSPTGNSSEIGTMKEENTKSNKIRYVRLTTIFPDGWSSKQLPFSLL